MNYFIGMGGNTEDVHGTFSMVISVIAERLEGELVKNASWYLSRPLPNGSAGTQSEYLNTAIHVRSALKPEDVLVRLIELEREHGRDREHEIRWGPRTLDLDILSCDDLVIESELLMIPHPRLHERDFVLLPLSELDPGWVHPASGLSIGDLIRLLPGDECYVSSFYSPVATTASPYNIS